MKKITFVFFYLFFYSLLSVAQTNFKPEMLRRAYFTADDSDATAFIKINIRYPKQASENNIGGKVMIGFTIKKDSTIDNIKVLKGIRYGCDEEAIRVVKKIKWHPATYQGKPVTSKIVFPVNFQLHEE